MGVHVLVVDDEAEVGRFFETFLRDEKGFQVAVAHSGGEARQHIAQERFDLALVDLKLPDADGIDLLRAIKGRQPGCPVIIMTGYSTVKSAVDAIKLGAYDYLDKPFDDLDQLEAAIDRAVGAAARERTSPDEILHLAARFGIVAGAASPLRRVLEVARKIAAKNVTVLLQGATGTGKECVARFLHATSPRAARPFVGVNCGAFTETLLESELFGHERGAFTGAEGQRRGIFELADGGTLFLDEIGEASPAIQVKLLKVLETGEFLRVGGETPVRVDVRVVAATNVDLRAAVGEGRFRKDLFYRLDVVSLTLPPLRERPEDIELLMGHFVDRYGAEKGGAPVAFTPEARRALLRYPWPGNVRELANVVAGMMALREEGPLGAELLPAKIAAAPPQESDRWSGALDAEDLEAVARQWGERFFERIARGELAGLPAAVEVLKSLETRVAVQLIRQALDRAEGDRSRAADLLGVNPRVLRYYLRERRK
ncbi:MAG: sigma-54 dependent transcriptional regulator [Deferrisomatales bacterium]